MVRPGFLICTLVILFCAGRGSFAGPQKSAATKTAKPEFQLVVPTWTDHKDTLPMDLMQPVYIAPAIPMEDALREEQKNPKKVVIVPAPPPPPGKDYIPPKYPDRKPKD